MDSKENIVVIRNIFYKCFFVGLIFLALAMVLYMPCKCFLAEFYQTHFGISEGVYYKLWVAFIGLIKTIIVFLFLVPALALHWATIKCPK